VEGEALDMVAEENNEKGIASTFALWKQKGISEEHRFAFYLQIISDAIQKMEETLGRSLSGIPLIISGMASANIGMMELPYKPLPFLIDGSDLFTHAVPASEKFPHPLILVSGVRSADDVMRGEESQLIGCFSSEETAEQILIFPGTHSKHITVIKGIATAIQTYLTGELFQLLCTHSLLAGSVEAGLGLQEAGHLHCFEKGVQDAAVMNPLHAFFLVRTNQLFQKMDPRENYHYLSGLLIGLELKELLPKKNTKIILVSNKTLEPYYTIAFAQLGLDRNLPVRNADQAILRGHYKIYEQCQFLLSR
jgi:2-dehydro-3-deoxygalactonokinase